VKSGRTYRQGGLTKEAQHSEPRWWRTIGHCDGLSVGLGFASPVDMAIGCVALAISAQRALRLPLSLPAQRPLLLPLPAQRPLQLLLLLQ